MKHKRLPVFSFKQYVYFIPRTGNLVLIPCKISGYYAKKYKFEYRYIGEL